MTRTRRSLYSLAAMYLNTLLMVVFGLLVTPLLFEWLGDARLGLVRMGQQWLGWALLLGLGLDTALNIRYAKAQADGSREEMVRVIRGAVRAYARVAIGCALWAAVLIIGAEWFFNLNDPALLPELRLGLLMMLIGQIGTVFLAFRPLAEAQQRGYVSSLCTAAGTTASGLLAIGLAWSGGGLPGQFAALAASPLVAGLLLGLDALRRYPELLRSERSVEAQRAFDPTMLLYQILARLGFLSDMIFVGLMLGSVAVAQFASTQGLMLLISGVLLGIGNATWGAFASLHHAGQHEAFCHRLVQLTRIVTMLGCAIIVPIAVMNKIFVVAWVKEESRYGGDLLSAATAVYVVLHCVVSLWGWPLVTLGKVKAVNRVLLAGVPLGIALSLLLIGQFDSAGMTMGTAINLLLVLFPGYLYLLHRQFGLSMRELVFAVLGPALLALPYAGLMILLAGQLAIESWVPSRVLRMGTVAAIAGAAAIVYLLVAAFVVLPAADRREWSARFFKRNAA